MATNQATSVQLIGAFAAANPDARSKKKALTELIDEMETSSWIRNMDWKAIREKIALHDPSMATKLYEVLQQAGMMGPQDEE